MEPTQAVIARYMGVIKHEELIALGMVLAQIHIQKLYLVDRAMSQFEARKAAEKAEADKKAPGPSPEDTQERAH
jgi:Na+-transporting methylmalonyl-CoA/oxaloacetate decarboxylase gamma subunit